MSPLNITQPLDSIRYMVYNGYYKVMSNIPKMGHLATPVIYLNNYNSSLALRRKSQNLRKPQNAAEVSVVNKI